jgi:hypothetical protein
VTQLANRTPLGPLPRMFPASNPPILTTTPNQA